MWCVCPKLDCASLSFIKSFSYIKGHCTSRYTTDRAQSSTQSECPAAMSFLELRFWRRGRRGKNGIEFQRTNVCLNEFPAPLMLRGGRASKCGSIDSEIMLVCISRECVFMCISVTVRVHVVLARRQPSEQCLEWVGGWGIYWYYFLLAYLKLFIWYSFLSLFFFTR